MENLTSRTWLAVVGLVATFFFISPNFINTTALKWWPATKLNFGLDIQGGLHLVMGVDVDSVVATTVTRQTVVLKDEFAKDNIQIKDFDTANGRKGEFVIVANSNDEAKKIEKLVNDKHSTMLQVIGVSGDKVEVRYIEAYLLDQKKYIIGQAIETIRNRIDEFGVSEPSIAQQGENRIIIQLPGLADAEKAKQLINTTAKLDFMIVSEEKSSAELAAMVAEAEKAGGYSMATLKYSEYVNRINEDLKSKLPAKTIVYFEKLDAAKTLEAGSIPMLLQTDTDLGGDLLDTASVSFDQFNNPEVAIRFNPVGSNKFADLTGTNVNRRMAVVLDKVVKTAPNIKQKITGGNAVITLGSGGGTNIMEEAKLIATALRAGALPAPLEQLEERRVGPSVGQDSLDKAETAAFIGSALVILFMLVYYKGVGVVTAITLVLNIIAMIALLGAFGATLTLPGIAGMALTVGFAVDANVLINERIKEELALGSSMRAAIEQGFSKAMSAIIDSNVTTSATAIILIYFGTGPVRGFAVTLLIGLVTTLFANVFISKVLMDNLVHRFGFKKLSV